MEIWSVMCFPIYCLPSFCPLLPGLHLAEPRLGLFAHIKRSRWLVPQADSERGGGAMSARSQQENRLRPGSSGADDGRKTKTSPSGLSHHKHLTLHLHYMMKFKSALGSVHSTKRVGPRAETRGDGVKHKSRSDHGRRR